MPWDVGACQRGWARHVAVRTLWWSVSGYTVGVLSLFRPLPRLCHDEFIFDGYSFISVGKGRRNQCPRTAAVNTTFGER